MSEMTAEQKGSLLRLRKSYHTDKETLFKIFTDERCLSKWWAPEGYQTLTQDMSFTEGGRWAYQMMSETDASEVIYCVMEYVEINIPDAFSYKDYYTDSSFKVDPDMPANMTSTVFIETDGVTEVMTTIEFDSESELEAEISAGLIEGTEQCYQNIEHILSVG